MPCNGSSIWERSVVFEADTNTRLMSWLRRAKPKDNQHAYHAQNKAN